MNLAIFAGFAKKKSHKEVAIYAFGLSTCFNDSTAYLTDIIEINPAYIVTKTNFLVSRNEYSMQLKNYFIQQNMPNQTCAFFFANKRAKIEKNYIKLRKRLTEKEKKNLVQISTNEFSFTPIPFEE